MSVQVAGRSLRQRLALQHRATTAEVRATTACTLMQPQTFLQQQRYISGLGTKLPRPSPSQKARTSAESVRVHALGNADANRRRSEAAAAEEEEDDGVLRVTLSVEQPEQDAVPRITDEQEQMLLASERAYEAELAQEQQQQEDRLMVYHQQQQSENGLQRYTGGGTTLTLDAPSEPLPLFSTKNALLALFAAAVSYCIYTVYFTLEYPQSLLQKLDAAQRCVEAAQAIAAAGDNDEDSNNASMKELKKAEGLLRAAIAAMDKGLPEPQRSNIAALQRHTASTQAAIASAAADALKARAMTYKRKESADGNDAYRRSSALAPEVIPNEASVLLLPYTCVQLGLVLQMQAEHANHNSAHTEPHSCLIGNYSDAQVELLYQSEACYLRSLQLYSKHLGLHSPQALLPSQHLGWLYCQLQQYDRAQQVLRNTVLMLQDVKRYQYQQQQQQQQQSEQQQLQQPQQQHQEPQGSPEQIKQKQQQMLKAVKEYESINKAIGRYRVDNSSNMQSKKQAQQQLDTPISVALLAICDSDVESELHEMLGTATRALAHQQQPRQQQHLLEAAAAHATISLVLLMQRMPAILRPFVTIGNGRSNLYYTAANAEAATAAATAAAAEAVNSGSSMVVTGTAVALSDSDRHRIRRAVDLLTGLSSDLHHSSSSSSNSSNIPQQELASRAALAAVNVMRAACVLHTKKTVPLVPLADSVLPKIITPAAEAAVQPFLSNSSTGTTAAAATPQPVFASYISKVAASANTASVRARSNIELLLSSLPELVSAARAQGFDVTHEAVAALANAAVTLTTAGSSSSDVAEQQRAAAVGALSMSLAKQVVAEVKSQQQQQQLQLELAASEQELQQLLKQQLK